MAKKPTKPTKSDRKPSLASLWDGATGDVSNAPSPGEHTMRLNSIELKDDPAKGIAAFASYEVIEGEEEGKKGRQMYKLRDAAGNAGPGLNWLKSDMAKLGYEDIAGKKLERSLKKVTEEQPLCSINVVESGNYTNFKLIGLADEEEIEDEDEDDEDEEEEKPKKGKKAPAKKKGKKDEDEDEEDDDDEDEEDSEDEDDEDEEDEDEDSDDDEEDEDDEDEDDEDDEDDDEEDEDDEDEDEDDEEDDDDDEDEDEEEEPAPKKKKGKSAPVKPVKKGKKK